MWQYIVWFTDMVYMVATDTFTAGVPYIIGSPPRKVSPGRQLTGKHLPSPAAARARRIFTGNLSAGKTFLGGDPIM